MNETIPVSASLDQLIQLGADFKPQFPPGADEKSAVPFVIIPAGMRAESLAPFLPPPRIERTVKLLEAGSFADYVNRFKTPDTLIFVTVTETGCTFCAMLDYHSPAPELKPAYCEHVAIFDAIETPDWKTWKAADRVKMPQVDFANWLEDNARLLVTPTGAELLELVTTLHGHKNARFNSEVRLDNGAFSVSYDEDVIVKGSGGSTRPGEFELPPTIHAGIAVFQGSDKYKVTARLKSRVSDRQLTLFFETVAKEEIVRESILLLVAQISERTAIVPLIGAP